MAAVERLIDAHEPDWIVLTGDMLPDFNMIGRAITLDCRTWWTPSPWQLRPRPHAITTLTLGNHEIGGFRDRELEAVPLSLLGKVGVLQGNPAEFGAWGFSREYDQDELQGGRCPEPPAGAADPLPALRLLGCHQGRRSHWAPTPPPLP